MIAQFLRMPLILILTAIAAASMYVPAGMALAGEDFHGARSFFHTATLALVAVALIAVARSNQTRPESGLRQLLALFLAFSVLPLLLAVPFHEALRTTSFLNAYLEMVSAVTTTGLPLFDEPGRLTPALHLWRAQVAWMGGFLMWVAAFAILAPLNLGGFEVTANAQPGQGGRRFSQMTSRHDADAWRLERTALRLLPVYVGLTAVLWVSLLIIGDPSWVALCHAMAVMATSGISPVGGLEGAGLGFAGEAVILFFLLFGLSRLTFSTDTITTARPGIQNDPEFRLGMLIGFGVPLLLFLRHWVGAFEIDEEQNIAEGLRALWGSFFTVLSFLTTTGFVSESWDAAQAWSGLRTPGLILLGLAMIGGGVATTAGGVKLLRVYALYLNGLREMERLLYPSSVGRATEQSRRLRRQGAFIAWIFFMLFAMSLALVTVVLAATGLEFENAMILAIASLSTTGPLATTAAEAPVAILALTPAAKLALTAAMVLGRLETLAIIALFSTDLWRN